MSTAMQNLPPEMQARLAQIMAQAQQGNPDFAESPHQAAIAKPTPAPTPSLMDHVIALRQEVASARQQLEAQSQVVEAVGNAVGQLYQMFQVQTQPTNRGANFQAQGGVEEGEY